MNVDLQAAGRIIAAVDAILIGTGAGMGVASSLPDFRDEGDSGTPTQFLAKVGFWFENLANPRWFAQDSQRALDFYWHRTEVLKHFSEPP